MQNKRRITKSQLEFEGDPKKFRQYLKKHKYDYSVEMKRDYIKDSFKITLKAPACDQWIFNFLRANYSLNMNGKWTEKL